MLVYVGKSYTTVAAGRKRKRVLCVQCRTAYQYDMVRVGVGRGHSAYMMDNSGAAGRASDRAEGDLAGGTSTTARCSLAASPSQSSASPRSC